jgi:hypothetical protein
LSLSSEQRTHFHEKGYVIVSGVVPAPLVADSVSAILECLNADLSQPSTWYSRSSWMVPLWQHAAFWNIRQHPAIHAVFAELLGTHQLWVSIDRACFKPPSSSTHGPREYDDFIHFDRHPTTSAPILQGLVCLNDTSSDQGGFQCAPETLRNVEQWMARDDFDAEELSFTDLSTMSIERPETKAGDLIVFTSRLAHGNGENKTTRPRIAQYVTMTPVGSEEERRTRVEAFEQRLPLPYFRKKDAKPEPGPAPTLTELGKRLLGVASW